MFFEIRMNSDYEMLVTEDEIFTPPNVKPDITPTKKTTSIPDADYDPPGIFIKEEPVEHAQTSH